MRNSAKIILVLTTLFASLTLTACYDTEGSFSVRREIVDVGSASVGDSVKAMFTFRNNKKEQIAISFLPECDCTTINRDMLRLKPRECGQLEVKVAVENPGEFIKYVYVQASGDEDFMAIAVKGHTK
ncbi:MAG: DUF1573 domain-containing protein [Bacteroidaceae bacterium]|nr:DUF1573 domain-containing protein [Bacteroidaceae bacterium]